MTSPSPSCGVCGHALAEPLFSAEPGSSLTSLCRPHPGPTVVHACPRCAHLQTAPMDDVDAYYAADYDILVASEDEDQIYEVRDGEPVYRTRHQVDVLLAKLGLDGPVDLLDYGCAKSSTTRVLAGLRPGLRIHLFDVSDRYVPYWRRFVDEGRWAVDVVPPAWSGKFDVVTSFFSLEHIPDVLAATRTIASLLRPGGRFHAVVPNVLGNIADFIVIDHCHHFTPPSLAWLARSAGLVVDQIDADSHRGALVLVAHRPGPDEALPAAGDPGPGVASTLERLEAAARFWRGARDSIRAFERGLPAGSRLAVYGAGFYGAFIASSLRHPERIECHLDQNAFLQGTHFNGRPVLPPAGLPEGITHLLVGLNPAHARRIIAEIPSLAGRGLELFFL